MLVKQVRLCGLGGQGIILAGTILGHAGMADGKWAAGTASYGGEARGTACRSEVVISDYQLIFPQLLKVDILVSMSQEAHDKFVGGVEKETGIVIYDDKVVTREISDLRQVEIPATSTAVKELGNEQVANMVMLSAMVEITGIVSKEALISAIRENIPERFKDINLRAVELGFSLGKEKSSKIG